MPPTRRRLPRSRREMKSTNVNHRRDEDPVHSQSSTVLPPPPPPIIVVQQTPAAVSNCLHYPRECSVYRYPPEWCSSCQVRASSICAQNGLPDIRYLFRQPPAYACAPVYAMNNLYGCPPPERTYCPPPPPSACCPIVPERCPAQF